MWAALTSLYVSAIVIVAAFLFAAVDWLELLAPAESGWRAPKN
jgi:hypothetical protein